MNARRHSAALGGQMAGIQQTLGSCSAGTQYTRQVLSRHRADHWWVHSRHSAGTQGVRSRCSAGTWQQAWSGHSTQQAQSGFSTGTKQILDCAPPRAGLSLVHFRIFWVHVSFKRASFPPHSQASPLK